MRNQQRSRGPELGKAINSSHKGAKGPQAAPTGARGAHLGFSGLGEISVKPLPERVWGEIGTPKGFLGTIQTIPLAKNLGKPRGGPFPPQSYVLWADFLGPQRAPRPSWARMWGLGSKNGFQGQAYQSCVLENHAESTGQCLKRSHMLQVMAQHNFGAGVDG